MKPKPIQLTKDDLARINSDVDKVEFRIDTKVSEYARLYERTYLIALRDKIDTKLKVIDDFPNMLSAASEPKDF